MWPASFYLCSLKKSIKHSVEFTVEFSTGVVTSAVEACQKEGFSKSGELPQGGAGPKGEVGMFRKGMSPELGSLGLRGWQVTRGTHAT